MNIYLSDPPIFAIRLNARNANLQREHSYEIRMCKNTYVDQTQLNESSNTDQHICVTEAIADYEVVYRTSWKASERLHNFTPALVKNLSQKGWLRLAILYVDAQPIAAQIWFVVHGKANIYRLVFDEKWKRYSPGSILTEHVMRYVIDTDRVSEIDFLTGNDRYKQDWMSVRRERVGFLFAKPTKKINHFSQMTQKLKSYFHNKQP